MAQAVLRCDHNRKIKGDHNRKIKCMEQPQKELMVSFGICGRSEKMAQDSM